MALNTSRLVHSALKLRSCVLALVATGIGLSAHAQSPEETVEFDLPAKDLEQALKGFGVTADKQLLFATEIAEGRTTNGVSGEMAPMQALAMLLEGTGLAYETTSSDVILVKAADSEQRGASDSKNLTQTSVLMAQNQASPTTTTSTRSEEGGTGIVTGKVTDARTGANLKGAKVTIEGTGQWTSTNDLGEFRFSSVPIGSATLTVSYLGYAGQASVVDVRGDGTTQNFALRGGSEIEEILVWGTRSSRALSLNQERTAENSSSVVTADLLGNFSGTTISEALRRVPGISFQQDEFTGEGTNIIVRGLEPDLNTVKLNGLELPIGNGTGRSADLGNILADSVEKITVHKSLLPNQDSSGTGGLVEIETKSPLDRPRRFLRFLVENGQRADNFSEDLLLSGTAAATFGPSDNIGIGASIQFRDRKTQNVGYRAVLKVGQHLPLDETGGTAILSLSNIDPTQQFPFEEGIDSVYPTQADSSFGASQADTSALTLSGEWGIGGHTNLSVDYQILEKEQTTFYRGVNSTFGVGNPEIPVASLGGEIRRAAEWAGGASVLHVYSLNDGARDTTESISFRGRSDLDKWSIDYLFGHIEGKSDVPFLANYSLDNINLSNFDPGLVQPAATDPIEGRIISVYGVRQGSSYPLPLLTPDGFAFLNDEANYEYRTGTVNENRGKNDRTTAEIGLRRNFDWQTLKYVEIGAQWEDSSFRNAVDATFFNRSGNPTAASLGLEFDSADLSAIGVDGGFDVLSETAVARFWRTLPTLALLRDDISMGRLNPDPRLDRQGTEEEEFAAYLQGRIDIGKLEVIGGARLSRYDIRSMFLSAPFFFDENFVSDQEFSERFTRLVDEQVTQTTVLPRILVNYRYSDDLVLRAGFFESIARPQIGNLTTQENVNLVLAPFFGFNFDQPVLSIRRGNPDLKPARTDNYDLSLEWYHDQVGVVKVSAFYKRIDNLLQLNSQEGFDNLAGVTLPDDPRFQAENLPDNLFISLIIPANAADAATIWGIETAIEHQFTNLPKPWDGLGIFANYTFTESEKTVTESWGKPQFDSDGNSIGVVEATDTEIADVPFDQQPEHSGTFAITYNNSNIDASLAYTYQERRVSSFEPHSLSVYQDEVDSLDFRLEYRFDVGRSNARIYIEGLDLLKSTDDPSLETSMGGSDRTPRYVMSGNYFGGRSVNLGVTASFQ